LTTDDAFLTLLFVSRFLDVKFRSKRGRTKTVSIQGKIKIPMADEDTAIAEAVSTAGRTQPATMMAMFQTAGSGTAIHVSEERVEDARRMLKMSPSSSNDPASKKVAFSGGASSPSRTTIASFQVPRSDTITKNNSAEATEKNVPVGIQGTIKFPMADEDTGIAVEVSTAAISKKDDAEICSECNKRKNRDDGQLEGAYSVNDNKKCKTRNILIFYNRMNGNSDNSIEDAVEQEEEVDEEEETLEKFLQEIDKTTGPFRIDEEDYNVTCEMLQDLKNFSPLGSNSTVTVENLILLTETDEEEDYKVRYLKIPCYDDTYDDIFIPHQLLDTYDDTVADPAVAPTSPHQLLKLESLAELDMSFTNITTLPPWIGKMNIEELFLMGTESLEILPKEICYMVSLQILDLSFSSISSIPFSIGRLKNLKVLNLSYTKNLRSVPESLSYLTGLHKLDFSSSKITSLPSLENLNNLQCLDLSADELLNFPTLGDMIDLRTLRIKGTEITSFPPLRNLENLLELYVGGSKLERFPDDLPTNLQKLSVYGPGIFSFPASIFGNLNNLLELEMRHMTDLTSLPELGGLVSLKRLIIHCPSIVSLPSTIGNLHNLEELNLFGSLKLQHLPGLGKLVNLKRLDLDCCYNISSTALLSLRKLQNLRVLDICHSSITYGKTPKYSMLCTVLKDCPVLGCIGELHRETSQEYKKLFRELSLNELSLNRARSRVVFLDETISFPVGLWNLIFHKAEAAFKGYPCSRYKQCCGESNISQSDAIFCLLRERGVKDIFIEKDRNVLE
jgi:Leucine-rich repeat (LRR) protein